MPEAKHQRRCGASGRGCGCESREARWFEQLTAIGTLSAMQGVDVTTEVSGLVSVPMSLAGALLFIALGVVTLNIYTQVGLLALAASIIRHGILIVEFANQLQRREGSIGVVR